MRAAIVGAGIAGLAAARTLNQHGIGCVVFERSKRSGGRCETLALSGYTFDSGATSIAPRGMAIEKAMLHELPQDDLCRVERPIYTHDGSRIGPGDAFKNSIARYAYRHGNQTLAKLLEAGLDVRHNCPIDGIDPPKSGAITVEGLEFDALIMAVPAPIAAELIPFAPSAHLLSRVRYRSCLSVMLGFRKPFVTDGYHAIVEPDQRHPLTWLSIESAKVDGRAPDGCTAMVAQMSADFSQSWMDREAAAIIDATSDAIERLYGIGWGEPEVAFVRRWANSLPENVAMFDHVNPAHSKVLVAGDALIGGRVEYAYESGVRAARGLIGKK